MAAGSMHGGNPDFFGGGEVNDVIGHGMRVVALEPGGVFGGQPPERSPSEGQPEVCYSQVVLDDKGIDPA